MKNLVLLLILLCVISCRQEAKKEAPANIPEETILEKIAGAHGYEHWKKVSEIRFTFNVDRDTIHSERSWIWDVKNQQVTRILEGDSISYFRNAVDSTLARTDAGFINDKYWLLAPFNLIWDSDNFTFDHQLEARAPISREPMEKLTIVYGNKGGYTPGDAYDFYFGEDKIIREWVFRKGNQQEPSTVTTWEDYENIGGLLISKMHLSDSGAWSLSFSGVSVQ